MKDNNHVYQRFSNNMAYLDNQITRAQKQLEEEYKDLYNQAKPVDQKGNEVVEMIEGQFTLNCPTSEINERARRIRDKASYVNQCIDELERTISDIPTVEDYSDKEIEEFLEKVSAINNKKYKERKLNRDDAMPASKSARDKENTSSNLPRKIVEFGRTLIGTPYVWGGSDPAVHGGVDCSGFVSYCAKKCGYSIGRQTTTTLIKMGKEVKRSELQIGDIIFPKSSHVGFYSGNGKFLHSPKPGDKVKEVDIYAFWRARRIFPGEGGDTNFTPSSGSSGSSGVGASDYYGPGEALELIDRTPDPEVSKVVVPQGAANWTTMASYLGTSASTLKKLNPGITELYVGTTLYIPTSCVTQARQLASKAKSNVSKSVRALDDTVSLYTNNNMIVNSRAATPTAKATSSSTNTVKEEQTPFQSFLNNEDYIKTHDLKEHKHKQRARLEINYDGKVRKIQTLISPISYSETYSNAINVNQTAGGWFISRHGENLPQLTISGYMLDTKYAPEKHAFMNEFKKYMTDKRNSSTGEYENNAIIKIVMEGVEYQGHVTSINFNKDANRPSLYAFNLSFTCIYYKNIRDVQSAVNNLAPTKTSSKGRSLYLGDDIATIINSY